ncbi:MAG: AtpZ/AtpI family protein [Flavobacteriia bacterium]|nr:AtpZ/AtpI family protein [Flavobacteriia bacterium]
MTQKNNQKENPKKPLNPYMRFSSMGIQMGVTIAICVYGGVKLDELWDLKPILTISLSLFGVFAGLYLVYKEVSKLNKDE